MWGLGRGALIGAFVVLGVLAQSADASEGVYTTVDNKTSYAVSLRSGNTSCWNADQLADSETVPADSSLQIFSSKQNSTDSGCGGASGHVDIHLYFKQPNGTFVEPVSSGEGNVDTSLSAYSEMYDWQIYHDADSGHTYFKNLPSDELWFPASPILSGGSGEGLFCVVGSYPNGEGASNGNYYETLTVEPEQSCSSTSSAKDLAAAEDLGSARPSALRPRSVKAHAAASAGVYDFLEMLQGACELFDLSSQCSTISDSSSWNLNNVSSDVAELTASGDPTTTYGWQSLSPAYVEQDNSTDAQGTLDYTFGYNAGEVDSTATTNGYQIGNAIQFGSINAPVNDTVSANYNFSTTDSEQTGSYESTDVSSSITTDPDTTTYLYGFQGTGAQAFDYTADLTFGDQSGNAEPLTTPAPAVMGYSPAQAQPCIGYLSGGTTPSYSVDSLYSQALAAAYTSSDPNLDSEEAAFMSAGGFLSGSSSKCPGFPSGFSSGGIFDGSGTATANALGGGSTSSWDAGLGGIVTCAYNTQQTSTSTSTDTPCVGTTSAGDIAGAAAVTRHPGAVIKASQHPRRSRLVGPKRSVLMIGSRDDHDTLITGPGRFNIIQGATGGETLVGRGKTDVLLGGSGNDRLHAGMGHESLYGHRGNDILTASAGYGVMHGGAGADTFVVRRHARYGLFGEDGNDRFFIYNTPRTLVAGGPGNDTYHLFGRRATRNIVELPFQGTDTLYTDHSLWVPLNIEIAHATGRGNVSLFGNTTTQSLYGGAGHDRLVAGAGHERLVGGSGDTTFVFTRFGDDVATGGSDQNWFLFSGTPLTRRALLAPRRAGANQITNFKIGRDHLVLQAKTLGSALLRSDVMLVEGHRPSPTAKVPTLMFNTRTHQLSFDPDGTGTNGARIIVTLSDYHCQTSSARERGKYRIHSQHGPQCLPVSAFALTR